MLRININDHNNLASEAACEPAESISEENRNASTAALPHDAAVEDPALTPFLDEIVDRLSSLPPHMHEDIRRELRSHLETRIAAFEELGMSRADATAAAIDQFGQPARLARRFRHSYESTLPRTIPWASIGLTLGVFGTGLLAYAALLPLEQTYPRSQAVSLLIRAVFCLGPLFAGAWIGRAAPRRAMLGVFYGFAIIATLLLPLFFYLAYSNTGVSDSYASTMPLIQGVLGALLSWSLAGTFSAALSSRIDWKTRNHIGSLPAFAARALSLSLGSVLVGAIMRAGWSDVFSVFSGQMIHRVTPVQFTSAQVAAQLAITAVEMFLVFSIPTMLGWRIGKTWPRTEMWRRNSLAYVMTAAAASSMSIPVFIAAALVSALMPFHPIQPHSSGALSLQSIGGYLLEAMRSLALFDTPVIAAAALISSDRARGGDRRLLIGAALAFLAYFVLDEKALWLYNTAFIHLRHAPTHMPLLVTLRPYYAPTLCGLLFAAAWRRLPRRDRAGDV